MHYPDEMFPDQIAAEAAAKELFLRTHATMYRNEPLDEAEYDGPGAASLPTETLMLGYWINRASAYCFDASSDSGWWKGMETGPLPLHVIPTKLALLHSEVSEAMEGDRCELMDDKIPTRSMLEVELVDVLIRTFDLAGRLGLDLGGAFIEKTHVNATRSDHKPENRAKKNGKRY